MTPLAIFAQAEFHRRRDALRAAVRQQGFDPARADRMAYVWLAIALRAGAEPPEAEPLLEDWRRVEGLAPHEIRNLVADELCTREERRAELARARQAAMQAAMVNPTDHALGERSWNIVTLACALGAPATLAQAIAEGGGGPRAQVGEGGSAERKAA